MAYSGHTAAVRLFTGTATTAAAEAMTSLTATTDRVLFQLTDAAKRHWDIDSTGPNVYINTTLHGSSEYTVNYPQGKVEFLPAYALTTAQSAQVTADLSYFAAASTWINANQWSLQVDGGTLEASVFGSSWRQLVAGMRGAGVSVGGFWNISTGSNPFDFMDAETRILFQLHPKAGDFYYEGYAWVSSNQVGAQVDGLVGETMDGTIDGPIYFTTST